MGFFSKIKKGLGIGTAKVELFVEPQYAASSNMINAKMKLTAKSDQHILSLTYKVYQKVTSGTGEDRKVKEYTLGEIELKEPFDIAAGEVQEFDVAVPFVANQSATEALKGMGGALGTLGKIGSVMSDKKIEYYLSAEADAKGVALDPSDTKRINII